MILNRYERMIARRYLLPGKGEGFIFVVAAFSVGAVALGVAALIIVMSVMNGFRAELFEKTSGLNGHAVVQGYDGRLADWERIAETARKTPGITSATPLVFQPLMASANGRVEGVLVRGEPVLDWRGFDFSDAAAELRVNDVVVQAARGSHPLPNPASLVAWLADHAARRGGLQQGVLVTTGALKGASPVAAGDRIVGDLGPLGRVELILS